MTFDGGPDTATPDPVLPVFLDALRRHRTITFVLADDLAGRCGLTNTAEGVVFLDAANTVGEMRATIAHELHHLVCPDCPDIEIEAMTAALLVPLRDAAAARATGDWAGTAARLGVDSQLVRARARTAGGAEAVG